MARQASVDRFGGAWARLTAGAAAIAMVLAVTPAIAQATVVTDVRRISVASDGTQANGASIATDITPDGRFVVFASNASNLVAGDTNNQWDVFIHDVATGTTELVSVDASGGPADGSSGEASVSGDGRFVAFTSRATDLSGNSSGTTCSNSLGCSQVYIRDRQAQTTQLVSVAHQSTLAGNVSSQAPDISRDGDTIAFQSSATNLVANDGINDYIDIFVRDVTSGTTTLIAKGAGNSQWPVVAATGDLVFFWSEAPNIVSSDANGRADVFAHDRTTGSTEIVSVATGGAQGNGMSAQVSASADGRYVSFSNNSTNLDPRETSPFYSAYFRDLQTGSTVLASVTSAGTAASGPAPAAWPGISDDGRYIMFEATSSGVVAGVNDAGTYRNVYVRDRATETTAWLSAAHDGSEPNGHTFGRMTGNGSVVVLNSSASNLVSDDTNGVEDVFVAAGPGAANDAPTAVADGYVAEAGITLTVTAVEGVLANDTDLDGDALTATLVGSPSNGTLTLGADGSFDYTPAAGFTGTDQFTYSASDGTDDSNVATVTITVTEPDLPTWTVNDIGDTTDAAGCTTNHCTLREAIARANAEAGADTIDFELEGVGPHTIAVTSALPTLTGPVVIDGGSEPGCAGHPNVVIDGSRASNTTGLRLSGGKSVIRGLVVSDFSSGWAISVQSSNNKVQCSYIGTNAAGTAAAANNHGIVVTSHGTGNEIGGPPPFGNVASGNTWKGIEVAGSANIVTGNLVGTDASGEHPVPNATWGVILGGSNNRLGGTTIGERNVIAGNGNDGVRLPIGSNGNTVQGNWIGVEASSGTTALPNGGHGLFALGTAGTAGSKNHVLRDNVISGNLGGGVQLSGNAATGNLLENNLIGVGADGATSVRNGSPTVLTSGWGVFVSGPGNTLRGNTVANNGTGVRVRTTGVTLTENSIYDNAGVGIEVDVLGVPGPPQLQSLASGTVSGELATGAPVDTYTIELFASDSCDPSGYGEGKRFVASAVVTTTDTDRSFSIPAAGISDGEILTATATASDGSTSGFSTCLTAIVQDTAPPVVSQPVVEHPGNGVIEVTATADDTSTGGSNITAAQYQVEGGSWEPMPAADGTFNATVEEVAVTAPTLSADGDYTYCVRAQDAEGNVSAGTCTTFAFDLGTSKWTADPAEEVSTGNEATSADPLHVSVTSPTGGDVSVAPSTAPAPSQYTLLGASLQIEAPDATVDDPLTLTFRLDDSAAGTTPLAAITVFRDTVAVADCTSTTPSIAPDPCVSDRSVDAAASDVLITVLTSHASLWQLGTLTDSDGEDTPNGGPPSRPGCDDHDDHVRRGRDCDDDDDDPRDRGRDQRGDRGRRR